MTARFVEQRTVDPADLDPYPGNPNIGDVDAVRESLRANGQYRAPVARLMPDGRLQVLAGHTTRLAAIAEHLPLRVDVVEAADATARRIVLADNRTAQLAHYDDTLLLSLLDAGDLTGTGWDEEEVRALLDNPPPLLGGAGPAGPAPTLADRFLIPPFDVLNAREGWWQDRKRQWLSLGIKSELGRDARNAGAEYSREQEVGLIFGSASARDPDFYRKKSAVEALLGKPLTLEEFEADHYAADDVSPSYESGTSIFDPVLCELVYRWFTAEGMTVLDPFAGGSVRGLVASILGRRYIGNDLRAEQIDANREQADDFTRRGLMRAQPAWSAGDSAAWTPTLEPESADLLFRCPPYLWLERYSDDPLDLSNATAADFEIAYTAILTGAARVLRPDRYAVIVVGDVRDSRGHLVDFRGMTAHAASAAGLAFQSGAVLVTQVGSLAVRAGRSFSATRVLGRTHQDVLVFVKGSASKAAQACGDIDLTAIPDMDPAHDDRLETVSP